VEVALNAGSPTGHAAPGGILPAQPSHFTPATIAEPPAQLASTHPVAAAARVEPQLASALAQGPDRTGHQVLVSNPAQLDVGVFDNTRGWLRIRAELSPGGAVNASLTAGPAAYEPLRAALPEMANYLQSEAVSVNKIAIHRIAEDPSVMGASAQGQQNAGTPAHSAGQEQAQTGAEVSQGPLDQRSTRAVDAAVPMGGLSLVIPQFPGAFGFTGNNCGSWLNVCA
jgi:hypothetical protein